ncbi:DP-EP family protein [Nitrospirillum sp. BR 11828]|uniref:DP-EP family protein n=1 Tax=Nitrospirillum sp. BR 11828 TaxID=3104325 RepID=UPI002ACB0258|nr:DP-EP family protein [Nitrospirillum sp. BR 11828]MDZ5650298.1 DP-EP family protein [Nitrospirillum sp. BR 11828]
MNIIEAIVTIKPNGSEYDWTYSGTGINPDTGMITLPNHDPTQITYTLCPATQQSYSFAFVNLSTAHAVTRQITSIQINATSIVIQDENLPGRTETTPFGFLLIARPHGEITDPIVSPDPVVVNDPGPRPPCE